MNDTPFDGSLVASGIAVGLVILCALAAYFVTRVLLLRVLNPAIARAKPAWDAIILERRVFHLVAYAAPALVINLLLPFLLRPVDRRPLDLIGKALSVYLIVVGLLAVNATVNAALDIYQTFELSKTVPLTGVVQGIKVVIYGLAGFFIVAALLGIPVIVLIWPVVVLMVAGGFVFKDPILGFVAGIELAADNLVAIGDWIEVPDTGASGHVLEISLVAVKVQNWDNTITMIPTYDLVSNPFTNWRGMFEGGGRRFIRPVYIDTNTIKFCTEEMLEAFSRLNHVSEYVRMRKEELAEYDVALADDDAELTERRGFTNLSVFRAYVIGYLRNHPLINQDMMLMVRLLEPTPHGLPVEIYAFTKETEWVRHETVQSDIVDHVLSVAPEFGLKAFQYPAGTDFSEITQKFEG